MILVYIIQAVGLDNIMVGVDTTNIFIIIIMKKKLIKNNNNKCLYMAYPH